MSNTPLFKWGSGEYAGFIYNGKIFDPNAGYLGWIEKDGSAWRENGTYWGELTAGNYLLRNEMKIDPISKLPKIPPIPPVPPVPSINRIGKIGKIGWRCVL